MILTITQAAASAAILLVTFAVIIVAIEEFRLWRGQREVDRINARVAHNRAVAAARRRHPSAIMRAEMDADLAADIAAQKAKTTRALNIDETKALRRELRAAEARRNVDQWLP